MVGKTDTDELVIGFDARKAFRTIEQFLIARQALYETVYYHKTVHAAEGMVALFLKRVKDGVRASGEIQIDKLLSPYVKVMSGEVLSQEELLRIDDFSLLVLIDVLSNTPAVDITVRDLGRRILARDLFKLVPCHSEAVEEFLGRPGSYEQIFAAIKPFCPGDPKYYLVVDRNSLPCLVPRRASGVTSSTPIAQRRQCNDMPRSAHTIEAIVSRDYLPPLAPSMR